MVNLRKNKNNFSNDLRKLLFLIFFPIIYYLLFFYLKYKNQNLLLSDFDFFYLGNVINIILLFVLLVELVLFYLKNKKDFLTKFKFLFMLEIFGFVILMLLLFESNVNLNYPDFYILNHPFEKVFVGSIYYCFILIQVMLLSILWFRLINTNDLVIVRSILNSFITMFLLLGFTFVFTAKINYQSYDAKLKSKPHNIGVVLGAAVWPNNKPSDILMMRLNTANELYKNNIIQKIQLTGGNAPGELSESQVAFNYLKKFKINSDDIFIENKTSSTTEQIQFINKINIIDKYDRIIIISDNYHLKRINQICKFFKLNVFLTSSDISLPAKKLIYYRLRETFALLTFWLFAL